MAFKIGGYDIQKSFTKVIETSFTIFEYKSESKKNRQLCPGKKYEKVSLISVEYIEVV